MQVFFSYGHDTHKDFVHRLAEEIESLSKGEIKVWIDTYGIKFGDHWRDKITEGILESQSVIAFLSKYSAREESVCRDELSIALVSKHGMIRTILLDAVPPKGDFIPSSRLSEYQWRDLSDYQSVQKQGEEAFSEYISTEAKQIIELLNSDEIKKYNDEIKRLRKAYCLPEFDDWTKFDHLLKEEMIGRNWLFDKIKKWEEDPKGSKVMMLYGQPGAGKSMFSAHLQMRDPAVVAAFPCDCSHQQYSTTESIIINISYRLALRIKDYRTWILAHLSDTSFDLSGDMLFNRLILQPLSTCTVDGDRAIMVIVVDALDEMENDTLAKFIANNAEALRPYVRFLITSRKIPEITERFNKYPNIDFDLEEQHGRADIEEYFKSKLCVALAGYEGSEQFINKLIDYSHLMFTYAECVCNNILADIKAGCFIIQEYLVPNGIGELYKQTLDRSFNEERGRYSIEDFKRTWRKPLSMVLASPEPLPISTLKLLMDWQDDELNDFLHPLSTLLTNTYGRLQVFHRSFGEWLYETKTEYKTSTASGISALAEACYCIYKDSPDDMDEYILLYTTRFLRESRKRVHKKAYYEVCRSEELRDRIFGYGDRHYSLKSIYFAEELITILKHLIIDNPEDTEILNEYGLSISNLAFLYEEQDNYELSILYYNKTIDFIKEHLDQDSVNMQVLSDSLAGLGRIYEQLGDLTKAQSFYSDSVNIKKELYDNNREDREYVNDYHKMLIILIHICKRIYESLEDESQAAIYNDKVDQLQKQLEKIYIEEYEKIYIEEYDQEYNDKDENSEINNDKKTNKMMKHFIRRLFYG
ncbi:toll/interleukin-1 receptor domain-containing protein [Ruminococcus albus]|uniref:TIR domain-containing protein n=1 Tax=Ruminococcus albus TaxID=1264 RepID=A0A1H7PIT9_RUMAL|nr:toll/interleukin-1 receptor domain-containing protein [Ruminococcus albus]SEL35673.1 TIR domain-containing protein [Ruminococcus albus]